MPRGGHARSGPQPDPNSLTSAQRGLVFTPLPAGGYQGPIPDFPLSSPTDRESDLWAWAWRTPQADAWAKAPWRWHAVAMWVRTAVLCESMDATAADKNSLHRFADQIGLTPAGLKENGWKIADAEPEKSAAKSPAKASTSRNRLKVIPGGAA